MQPLPSTLAAELQAFTVNRPPDSSVFTMPPPEAVVKMLRADLTDARSAWIDEAADNKERERREKSSFLT